MDNTQTTEPKKHVDLVLIDFKTQLVDLINQAPLTMYMKDLVLSDVCREVHAAAANELQTVRTQYEEEMSQYKEASSEETE